MDRGAVHNNFCLVAGGSGGHVFPALALGRELARRGRSVFLLSDRRGARFYALRAGAPSPSRGDAAQVPLVTMPLARASLFSLAWSLPWMFIRARALLRRKGVVGVVGFGGVFSIPVVLAARSIRIRVVLHEQNAHMGRANRWLARFAGAIALGYRRTRALPRGAAGRAHYTGVPIRSSSPPPWQKVKDKVRVLVIGGSQGAGIFSDILPAALARLSAHQRKRLYLVQQCRKEDRAALRKHYRRLAVQAEIATFFEDMDGRIAASHLVIGRAGASTLAEIRHMQRPAIVVPFAAAMDDHQRANACQSQVEGAIHVMDEGDDPAVRIAALLADFIERPQTLDRAAQVLSSSPGSDGAAAHKLADMVDDARGRAA